jgi:pimeloyl-ACP methyl ester carboxylesterase
MNPIAPPSKPASRKLLSRALSVVLLAGSIFYLIALVATAMAQRRMIYHPGVFTPADADQMALNARLERWTNTTGAAIGWKRLSPAQPAQGRVLVVYGNASVAIGCAHYADDIQSVAPFDVFILEYPGYGDRPGSPNEKSLFRAADEALPLLGTNVPVYLVGESLGSGVAAYLAGTHPDRVAGLMLLSPYNRLADVAQYQMPIFPVRLLLLDRFPSEDYLKHYHGPVGMMVDGWDVVVPAKFGLRLYHGYAGPKRLWEYPHGNHISIGEPPVKFWKSVVDFWQTNAVRN